MMMYLYSWDGRVAAYAYVQIPFPPAVIYPPGPGGIVYYWRSDTHRYQENSPYGPYYSAEHQGEKEQDDKEGSH